MPLICTDVVEMHCPDRVLRQFGMQQPIPERVDTKVSLHKVDLRGNVHQNWATYHDTYIDRWNNRLQHVITRDPLSLPMAYDDQYMVWYRSITRRHVDQQSARFDVLVRVFTWVGLRLCFMVFKKKFICVISYFFRYKFMTTFNFFFLDLSKKTFIFLDIIYHIINFMSNILYYYYYFFNPTCQVCTFKRETTVQIHSPSIINLSKINTCPFSFSVFSPFSK